MLLIAQTGAFAQSGTSSVRGTVTDQQNSVIAGASVTLTNTETNAARTKTTGENGVFTFDLIPPGTYRLEAEAANFKKSIVPELRALVDQPVDLTLQLEAGNVNESVTVTDASGVLLNTQDASLGNNFNAQQISQLPLESRNVVALLSLQPGVTQQGYVTGSRSDQANVTLDGVDVNEQQTGLDIIQDLAFDEQQAFSSVLRVTTESVQEFRVTTTNPNASQGRSAGGQVSLVTKSGTNDFHGAAYWSHRNTIFTANDFFNNLSGVERPTLLRNVYGGALGGPIKRDRAFFFYGYEGRRDARQTGVTRVVPLASLGRGEIRYETESGIRTVTPAEIAALFPETVSPQTPLGVNPVALAALADAARRYPANDCTTEGDGCLNTGGFRFNAPTPLEYNAHTLRLDFNATEDGRHLLFFRGNFQHDLVGGVPQFPDTPRPNFWNHPYGFVAGHTWTISNSVVNNFRYGLTREAFTNQGDSTQNEIFFRFVFEPSRFNRTLSRVTPTHNITDDLSWVRGNHNFQFGTNIRLIRNRRETFANSFDYAVTNPSYYEASGAVLDEPFTDIVGSVSPVQNAVAAVLGRFSDYGSFFNFDLDGSVLPAGEGVRRTFATEEYDWYVQDSWKLRPNLTLTLGLRYGLSRPVYEVNGFQVKPTRSLSEFFAQRVAGAEAGRPFNDPITFDLAGPANGKPGFYDWDKNNFQPRVSVAWSPEPKGGFWHTLLGGAGSSVFRGGFAITNDYFGQQLAVNFDLANPAGFSSTDVISANTYNVTDSLAPLFTGFNQDVRSLQGITVPGGLTFPLTVPSDGAERIESSLDDNLVSPIHYSWTFSYGRQMPAGLSFEAAYIGRAARNLLASRDIMHFNNLRDPASGQTWYEAARLLDQFRVANTPITDVPPIPFFENLFPNYRPRANLTPTQNAYRRIAREAVGGLNILDWTFLQSNCGNCLDNRGILPNMFVHPQFATLDAWSTIATSDYHAGTFTLRQRYKQQLSFDVNYTFSKSLDTASGLQQDSLFGYTALILNPLDQDLNRSYSDFDVRHILNANFLWQIPIGRGRWINTENSFANGVLGGWQLSGIFRANSGLPVRPPIDQAQWATNWNTQSFGVRIRPIETTVTDVNGAPNIFTDQLAAYRSFRNALPGEVGDRNSLRLPGYWTLDMGLAKSFSMPWSEGHKLQFRAEAFNVTNTQHMGTIQLGRTFGLDIDPSLTEPQPLFGAFTAIQGTPRVLQFGLRYSF